MKDPIKIIHKFKNNNGRIQYKIYIFIGFILNNNILDILKTIKNKDLLSTFNQLSKSDYNKLEEYYGKYWYEYFFTSYHISSQKKIIENNITKKKQLENKYGKDWYSDHIKKVSPQKVAYSFASSYFSEKIKQKDLTVKKKDIDFRITNENEDIILPNTETKDTNMVFTRLIKGGQDEDTIVESQEIPVIEEETVELSEEELDEQIKNIMDVELQSEELSDIITEELQSSEIEVKKEDIKELNVTSNLIEDALGDSKWKKKIEKEKEVYDNKLDSLTYDSKLDDIYEKIYIKDQYIFKDDTIKNMRNKITTSIPISNKFGENIKLLPETQYFGLNIK
jgi:hypothetical protein